jgi:diguanylate cyclase (GGDEF)-like protein
MSQGGGMASTEWSSGDRPESSPLQLPDQPTAQRFSRVWQPELDRLEQPSAQRFGHAAPDDGAGDLPSAQRFGRVPPPVDPSQQPSAQRFGRAWLAFLVAGAVVIALYPLLPRGIVRDIVYVVVGLSCVATILTGVRLHRPVRARPWYLMAAGQLIWVCGDIKGSWDSDVAHLEGFPAAADAFYLAAYPVLAAGLVVLIWGRRQRGDMSGLLDSAIVTAGLGILSWVLLARPTIADAGESFAAAAVAVAYPVGDIILLGVLVRFLTTPGARTTSLGLLLTAVGLQIAADTAASALSLLTFNSTGTMDVLWLASYVVWGASALHPSMYALSKPAPPQPQRFSRARLIALTLAVLVAPGTLAVQQLLGLPLDVWAVVIGSVVMGLLVIARMWVAISQIMAVSQQREKLQHELLHRAAHDSLTGLPNRAQAMRLIQGALARAQRSGAIVGLLFVDLDGFKAINDSLGHRAGDQVLRTAAARMQAEVRAGDVVARLGGDEFVVLLEPLDQQAAAVAVADRLVTAVSRPMELAGGRTVRVGASVGVALSQDGLTDPEILLHESDVAVYRAKSTGRGRTEVFDGDLRREVAERSQLEAGIRAAIAGDQLVLHYQPIVSVRSGEVEGYEALVRWNRPGVGLLLPAEFISVAEQSDLICELDAWVLRRAARQLAAWNQLQGPSDLFVAVNVSGRHVARRRIYDDVTSALRAAGIEARQLTLEITENALLDDPVTLTNLHDLRLLGVSISIDDFGTGYNSITRLETLPVDIVKIDGRFLDRAVPSSEKLLRLIVQTAHAFGLPVVAEGVESGEQLAVLKSLNCESAQGYYLGRPADPRGLAHASLPRVVEPERRHRES